MSGETKRATFEVRRGHLDTLARALEGFDREISLSETGLPILVVTNPRLRVLSDHVLCCRDTDGTLAFFWPWGSRISAVDHPDRAARVVARMLSS